MKIKDITIEGLYKTKNINLSLDPTVNIISGSNGSYKSTFLRIISALCNTKPDDYLQKVQLVKIKFDEGYLLSYLRFDDSLLALKKQSSNNELLNELASEIKVDFNSELDEKSLAQRVLKADIISVKKDKQKYSLLNFSKELRSNFISTFDVPMIKDERGDVNDTSVLDQQLVRLEEAYAYYLSDLAHQVGNEVKNSGKLDVSKLQEIYGQNELFVSKVNFLFENTGKEVKKNSSKLEFTLEDITLSSKNLSSGEKQLLIILLTVLLQKKEECILIMDEPEISMHIGWQSQLIDIILELNPNVQLLLSTHSPSIFGKGWGDKVVFMDDIVE